MIIKKFTATLILFFVSTSCFCQVAIPDGKWNGKPWDKKALQEGISKGDKDALAEWAYCSKHTYQGTRYNRKLIHQRLKSASAKGSALGTYLLGVCYLEGLGEKQNAEKALILIKKAMNAGHPLARWRFSVCQRHGVHGVKKDSAGAAKVIGQCLKDGAWEANRSLGGIYESGQNGVVDYENAAKHYAICFKDHRDPSTAITLYKLLQFGEGNKGLAALYPEGFKKEATARVNEAASLGHPHSNYILAFNESRRGNINLAIPQLIDMVNDPEKSSLFAPSHNTLRVLCFSWYNGLHSSKEGCRMIGGDIISSWAAAKTCYNAGVRTKFIQRNYADAVLKDQGKKIVPPAEERKAIEMMRQLIKKNSDSHRAHHVLGDYFSRKYNNHNVDRKNFDRGMAHHIFHAKCASSAHWICVNYLTVKKALDPVKGVASAEWAIKNNRGSRKAHEVKWQADARKKLTPAQKEEVKKLIAEGFPHAEKFRKKAFEYLQKVGDIPADRKFKGDRDEDDEGVEEASLPTDPSSLMRAIALLVLLPEASAQPLFSGKEDDLMHRFLARQKLGPEDLKQLVILLIKDDPKLRALLAKHAGGKHAKRVKEISEVVGNGHNIHSDGSSLGAAVGWYMIYRDKNLTSSPYITKLDREGVVAKAGLHIGDVIDKCYGVDLRSARSRNLFMRLVACWPEGQPLELDIRRGRYKQTASDAGLKDVKKKFTITFPEK